MQNYYSNEHSFADKVEFWQVAGTITTVVTNRSDYLQEGTNRVLQASATGAGVFTLQTGFKLV